MRADWCLTEAPHARSLKLIYRAFLHTLLHTTTSYDIRWQWRNTVNVCQVLYFWKWLNVNYVIVIVCLWQPLTILHVPLYFSKFLAITKNFKISKKLKILKMYTGKRSWHKFLSLINIKKTIGKNGKQNYTCIWK